MLIFFQNQSLVHSNRCRGLKSPFHSKAIAKMPKYMESKLIGCGPFREHINATTEQTHYTVSWTMPILLFHTRLKITSVERII